MINFPYLRLRSLESLTITDSLTVEDCCVLGANSAVFQPTTDSTTFFQILDADGGTSILNVDSTNESVLFGSVLNTGSMVEIVKAAANPTFTLSCYHDTEATTSLVTLRKADGTEAAPALVDDNAVLGTIHFDGHDGSGWHTGAKIEARIDGTPSDGTDIPTELTFWTVPDGSATPLQRVTIDPDGNVGILEPSPIVPLHVVGSTLCDQGTEASPHTPNSGTMLEVRGDAIGSGVVDSDFFKGFKMALENGSEFGGQVQFALGRWEDNSNNARSSLVISLGHGAIRSDTNADADVMTLLSNGNVGLNNLIPESLLTLGTNSTDQGILRIWDGGGGNTPGNMIIASPNGTLWYFFVEDDGTFKVHNAAPTQNADGSAVGDQTD